MDSPPVRWARVVGLAALLACTGCDRTPPRGGEAADAVPRDVRVGRTYRSPPEFPLPFSTVTPQEVHAGPVPLEDGAAAVAFTWDGGPARRDSAFLYVRVLAPGTTAGAAREIVRTAAERLRIPGDTAELQPAGEHRWATVEYPLRTVGRLYGQPVRGWVAMGLHGGRWFYMIAQAPAGQWRPFSTRVEEILAAWQWEDVSGEPGARLDSV